MEINHPPYDHSEPEEGDTPSSANVPSESSEAGDSYYTAQSPGEQVSEDTVIAALERDLQDTRDQLARASQELERLRSENERLTIESRIDELTGLANRRGFFSKAAEVLSELSDETNVLLLSLDMSKFKEINDHPGWGHDVGDATLKIAAEVLQSVVRSKPVDTGSPPRPADIIGRLGGDEFAVMIPLTGKASIDQQYAREISEQIIATKIDTVIRAVSDMIIHAEPSLPEYPGIARLDESSRHELRGRIGMTAGAALVRAGELREEGGLEKQLAAADAQMYARKHDRSDEPTAS